MHWNDPELTILNTQTVDNDNFDGLSSWSRFKRILTKKWTAEIADDSPAQWDDTEKEQVSGDEDISTGLEQVHKAMDFPVIALVHGNRLGIPRVSHIASTTGVAEDASRPVSQASGGGIMVEEQGPHFVSNGPAD